MTKNKLKNIVVSGKRKTAVARAVLVEGSGKINVNKKNYKTLQIFDRLKIEEPIRISENILGKINFDVSINVRGGGEKSQIEAARLALAKAIVEFSKSKELTKAFLGVSAFFVRTPFQLYNFLRKEDGSRSY